MGETTERGERRRGGREAHQKLVGLYLLATIWMMNRLLEPATGKTDATPSW